MSLRTTIGAAAVAAALLGACSGDDGSPAATTAASDATGASTTTGATTPAGAATTATPATSAGTVAPTTSEGSTAALDALRPLLDAGRGLRQEAEAQASAASARITAGRPATAADYDAEAAIADTFYGLWRLVPAGLHPSVEEAALQWVYDLGNLAAPFVFAPGYQDSEWGDWVGVMTTARNRIDADQRAMVDAARAEGAFAAPAAGSAQAAAQAVEVGIALVRSFGHDSREAPLHLTVEWFGPARAGGGFPLDDCPAVRGAFEVGTGGCGVLFYDPVPPAAERARLVDAWLADRTTDAPGEPVMVWWDGSGWAFNGSWE